MQIGEVAKLTSLTVDAIRFYEKRRLLPKAVRSAGRFRLYGTSTVAPITDPAVATTAYSYHGLRWVAARMAVKMSGPPNVGKGELSRIARKKSPSAPK